MMENLKPSAVIEDMLLVSSPGEVGGLLCVDQTHASILSARPSTGVYLDDERVVVANQNDGGRSILVIEKQRTRRYELSDHPLDLHDVLIEEESLFVVDTHNNQVSEFCLLNMEKVNSWGLPGEPDSAHMNSVVFYQGRLLASIFGRFAKNREYKSGTLGFGQVIDVKTGEVFIDGLSQPHSLTACGELLYLCNSEESELRVYRGDQIKKSIPLEGYTRGIAISRNKIYVGISLSRNALNAGKTISASIVTLNSKTLTAEDEIPVPVPEIYDIRVIGNSQGLVLKAISSDNYEYLLKENVRLSQAYEELIGAYEQTKDAYEQTKDAYEQLKDAYEARLEARIARWFKKA